MVLRTIYYINTGVIELDQDRKGKLFDDNSNFRFYFDKQLRRTTASVVIQKWWRGVQVVKSMRPTPITIITCQRSATLIKHFYRGL